MSTKKTKFVIIYIRIGLFRLPIALPMRSVHEVIEGYMDFFAPFRWISEKIYGYLRMAEGALLLVKNYQPFDFADIDVKSRDKDGKRERVVIKVMTR